MSKYPNTDIYSKIYTFLIIIYPILSIYKIGQFNFGMIFMYAFILILVTQNRFYLKWPKYFWIFFVYLFLARIFTSTSTNLNSLISLNLMNFALILCFSHQFFDVKYGISIYKKTINFCLIFFFIQEILYYSLDIRIIGLIPGIELNSSVTQEEHIEILLNHNRSSSFFLEPAHFAQYILPFYALEVSNLKTNKSNPLKIIITTITLLLLRSGIGLIVSSLIWIRWIILYFNKISLTRKLLLTIVIIPMTFFSINLYINSKFGSELIERTEEFDKVDATTSAYVRIFRGYDLYYLLPPYEKIVGLSSPNNIIEFISSSKMYNLFQENDLSFNCIQSVLIYGGIVGLILFILHLFFMYRNNSQTGKMLLVTFIGMSFLAPIFLMGEMLLIYILVISFQKDFENYKNV